MTRALLLSWDLRLDVILVLGTAAMLYVLGWRRLRARVRARPTTAQPEVTGQQASRHRPLLARWRPVAYLSGLAIIALALMSPIDVFGGQLFYMHMIQHLLVMMVAVPLMLIANPFPVLMWGLPVRARRTVGRTITQDSAFRRIFAKITSPGISWLLFVTVYVGWHDQNMYDWALRSNFVHDIQHLTFFAVSMLVWWHITGAAPRFHRTLSTAQRLIFAISLVPISMFLGIAITFASKPIFEHYTTIPRLYGLSVMEDQKIAGLIMWIPGGMMHLLAAVILISRIVQTEANKPIDPKPPWTVDEHAPVGR